MAKNSKIWILVWFIFFSLNWYLQLLVSVQVLNILAVLFLCSFWDLYAYNYSCIVDQLMQLVDLFVTELVFPQVLFLKMK